MTKNTLLAIAAFAASIAATAKILSGEAPEGALEEAATNEEKPTRRRCGPAKQPETPPTEEKPAAAGAKTLPELQALIKFPVEGGKGQKVKDFLAAHGTTKLADLAPEHHAALAAEMKRLTLEVEAEQM